MRLRVPLACVLTTLASVVFASTSADAAPPDLNSTPLTLQSYEISIAPPNEDEPGVDCDYYNLQCGYVDVKVTFSGLEGRDPYHGDLADGNLTGTVQVRRTYGCEDATGMRLPLHTKEVVTSDYIDTRFSFGFTRPDEGDTVDVDAQAVLGDVQPLNCPAGATAYQYTLRARAVKLAVQSYVAGFPSASYRAPGVTIWTGRVPTPTPGG